MQPVLCSVLYLLDRVMRDFCSNRTQAFLQYNAANKLSHKLINNLIKTVILNRLSNVHSPNIQLDLDMICIISIALSF